MNDHFPGKWIGRNGPVAWPPRSPDLNPIDFYVWCPVKNEVHSTPVTTVDELWEPIVATFDATRKTRAAGTRQGIDDVTSQRMCCGKWSAL
jgi:hypothetical protein